jgi:hypothetical protein
MQGLVGDLASERIGEDLRNQLQPFNQRLRPAALRFHVIEGESPKNGSAAGRKGNRQCRLDAVVAPDFPIPGSWRRHVGQRSNLNSFSGQYLPLTPREIILGIHRLRHSAIRVSNCSRSSS